MKKTISFALLLILPLGCSSPPAEPQPDPPPRLVQAPQPLPAPPPGVLAPVDAWKKHLAQVLPAPWGLTAIEAQVQAPQGWSRTEGSRGLRLTFSDGAEEQPFWVLPQGFQGYPANDALAARLCAESPEFLLYAAKGSAPGWNHTEEVISALGLN